MDHDEPPSPSEVSWSKPDLDLLGMMIDVSVALGDLHFVIVSIASVVPLGVAQMEVQESLTSVRKRLADIRKTVDGAMDQVRQKYG